MTWVKVSPIQAETNAADVEVFLEAVQLGKQEALPRAGAMLTDTLVAALPMPELGCLYLDAANQPVRPEPDSPAFATLTRHFGSVKGARPRVVGAELDCLPSSFAPHGWVAGDRTGAGAALASSLRHW